jgi:hypothetical protein
VGKLDEGKISVHGAAFISPTRDRSYAPNVVPPGVHLSPENGTRRGIIPLDGDGVFVLGWEGRSHRAYMGVGQVFRISRRPRGLG